MICNLFPEPLYFLFSNSAPALLYYAYIPTTVIALFVGFYIFFNGRKVLLNQIFLAISLCFSFWTISALIQWTNIHSDIILFVWNFSGVILGLIAMLCIYFVYVFLNKKDISTNIKTIFIILLSPIILLSISSYNLSGFNITDCDAFNFESIPLKLYYTSLGVLAMLWIFILLVRKYRNSTLVLKKQLILMGIGIESFLFLFFVWIFSVAYFTKIGILVDSRLEMYGLIGMLIFILYISILIVRFKVFNIKLLTTQALVWGLAILIGSQFFFIRNPTNYILNSITFVGIIVFGQFLIKSVKREVKQKEEIQKIAVELESSNTRLTDTNEKLDEANEKLKSLDKLKTEFLSLASHQLRSPLTAIKGYTSMLLEGDFGTINDKQKEAVDRVFESSKHLTVVVEDLLNVSKIEQGGMQYIMAPFDFEKAVKDLATDLGVTAGKKGLKLTFETDNKAPYTVNGDMEKLRQVVLNLIDNSVKYTKEGWIKVVVTKDEINKKIKFAVSDSGMGISPETINDLFQKFSRGAGGKVNTGGSGLGLYLGKEIVGAHKGRIWAESAGEGKGSTFAVELDMA